MRSKTRLWAFVLAGATLGASLGPALADADFSGFLMIPGLPGESQDDLHRNEIDLVSYTQAVGTKACLKGIAVKNLDRASLGLAVLAISGQPIPLVKVTLRKTGENPLDVFVAVLENVTIGSIELVEVDGGPIPTERVVLLPRRATLTYNQQLPTGVPGSPITTTLTCP